MDNINYTLLKELANKKRHHTTDLSWNQIADQCGITGKDRGEKARKMTYDRRSSHTIANKIPELALDGKQFTISVFDKIDSKLDEIDSKYDANSIDHDTLFKAISEIRGDGTYTNTKLIELSEDDQKSPDVLLEKHGFDKNKFELVSAKNTMWHSQKKDKNNPVTLYSSKITVKPRTDSISFKSLKEDFLKFVNENTNNCVKINKIQNQSDYMLEINISDLHLGKLCHKEVTGCDYNTQIASDVFNKVIDNIIAETSGYRFEKILFVYSNDFFNYDTSNYTTTAGTSQSYDSNWQQLFQDGCHLLVNAIEKLAKIAPVETFYIGSNHDRQSAFYLTCYLNGYFRNNPNVIIDDSFMSRKLVKWGKSLIYFMHGDMPKKQINGIIAREFPNEWGSTLYREIHAAHYHSEQSIIESCGAICRFLPSVTGTDVWHYDNGYTGALTKTQSFIWSKEEGLKAIINTNAPYNIK